MRNNFYVGKTCLLFFTFQASPQGTNISKMLNNLSLKAEAHFLLSKPGNSSLFFQGQEAERSGPFLLLSEDEPRRDGNWAGHETAGCWGYRPGFHFWLWLMSWEPWAITCPLGFFCFFIFRKFVLDELVLYSLLLGKNDIILCIL